MEILPLTGDNGRVLVLTNGTGNVLDFGTLFE